MKFFVITRSERIPTNAEVGTCYLRINDWNDYSFQTLFHLIYISEGRERKEIGSIKIMKEGQTQEERVRMPVSPFLKLDQSYCSLGQGQSFYEELMDIPEKDRRAILVGLKDCVNDLAIFDRFENEPAMQTSLLRNITKLQVKKAFKGILLGNATLTDYHFQFLLKTNEDCKIDIKVVPNSTPPTNVHVLIGRNGVGKTRILSGIADELTRNKTNMESISLPGEIRFLDEEEGNGGFANLVTVVFSAFDYFTPIKSEHVKGDIRYQYVGLKKLLNKDDREEILKFKSQEDLKKEFSNAIKVCLSTQRKARWIEAIVILNSDPIFSEFQLDLLAEKNEIDRIVKIFDKLSSGHRIILLSITRLVELVEERTFVLIDEPENHLHPPLLASFIRALSDLIIKRNGVALIATHSPVVLQEVPKSCVTVVDRVLSEFRFDRPELETFGENVGVLTREVFRLEATESGFHKMITEHLVNKNNNYSTLMSEFNDQIGSEGRAIARSISIINDKG